MVVTGGAAGAGIEAVAEHGSVSGVVALGARLDREHLHLLADWPELALLSTARPDDRPALRSAVDAYLASPHPRSDVFVSAGGELGREETFEPRFTCHGFRYAEVEGHPDELRPDDVTAVREGLEQFWKLS